MISALMLAAAVSFTAADSHEAHAAAVGIVKSCTPRDAGTARGLLAARWVMDRVSRSGVDAELDKFRALTPDGEKSFANVIVEWKASNENAPWIVLLSHFDTAPGIGGRFEGANDGASTTGLMIALAAAVKRSGVRRNNIAFVWTDGEECRITYSDNDGLQGAKRAVKLFREKNRKVKAAINLDMLGDANLNITLPANGTTSLNKMVVAAANRAGFAGCAKIGLETMKDDFLPFLEAGFPATDIIDFEYGSEPGLNDFWHTEQDTIDKLSEATLLKSGRIVAELLNILEGENT